MSGKQHITCNVRRASQTDCTIAATLHANELPGEFLSLLGIRFLNALYRGINAHPEAFVLVAEQNSMLISFVSGATNSSTVDSAKIFCAAAEDPSTGRSTRLYCRAEQQKLQFTGHLVTK